MFAGLVLSRYADALREVYRAHGGDLDVATLFAEALVNRTPWRLWDLDTGDPAHSRLAAHITRDGVRVGVRNVFGGALC